MKSEEEKLDLPSPISIPGLLRKKSEAIAKATESIKKTMLPTVNKATTVGYSDKMLLRQSIIEQKNLLQAGNLKAQRTRIEIDEKSGFTQAQEQENEIISNVINMILEMRLKFIYYHDDLLPHPFYYGRFKEKLNFITKIPEMETASGYVIDQGILYILDANSQKIDLNLPTLQQYRKDLIEITKGLSNPMVKSFCYERNQLLRQKFIMHQMYNKDLEVMEQKLVPYKDFYNVRKIDTHIHHSAFMNSKHLCTFIRNKIQHEAQQSVVKQGEQVLTLQDVFDKLGLTPHTITTDALDTHADHTTFQRFDNFNNKYNPMGHALLREIFLKTDNYINGRYFAEITLECTKELEKSKYVHAELRTSIYGRSKSEWPSLAKWFKQYNMFSKHIGWMIQVPRLYKLYRSKNMISSFQEMLDNIFGPVIEATLKPEENPEVALLLANLNGFDSVDDESALEEVHAYPAIYSVTPDQWTAPENPPYAYWTFYFYANIRVINSLRMSRGMNVLSYRPHCGEAGSEEHLTSAFLTAYQINHGIVLQNNHALQYLYYLSQIGLAVSPLSNHMLFKEYDQNPFPKFFQRGLNVSLSTDDPLMFHMTRDPLLEEYAIASQVYKLSAVDLCEIAMNSVFQSNFNFETKKKWLGQNFHQGTLNSNDVTKSNVSNIRWEYRYEMYHDELNFIKSS